MPRGRPRKPPGERAEPLHVRLYHEDRARLDRLTQYGRGQSETVREALALLELMEQAPPRKRKHAVVV